MSGFFDVLKELFMAKPSQGDLIGLSQLKQDKSEPVKVERLPKKSDDVKISDLMRGV